MPTPSYASALNGFNGTFDPSATPLDYYAGPAGVAPGAAGFTASVLFRVSEADLTAGRQAMLWSNGQPFSTDGWGILLSLSNASFDVVGAVRVNTPATIQKQYAVAPTLPPTQKLVLVDFTVDPVVGAWLFVNGMPAGSPTALGGAVIPSAGAPLVGIGNAGVGLFDRSAAGVQILGVAYDNVPLGGSTSAMQAAATAHFQACLRAIDMAPLSLGDVPNVNAADFTNRYSVRQGAVSAAGGTTAPAVWTPSAGTANLTRVTDLPGSATLRIETPTNSPWL